MRHTTTRWLRIPKTLRQQIAKRNGMTEAEFGAVLDGKPKRSKYGNTRVTNDHGSFDSKREAEVYLELAIRQAAGEIRDLRSHPVYELHGFGGVRIGRMTPDFAYWDVQTEKIVVVDVKSKPTRTTAYRLRKRLFEAEYGLKLEEIF